MAKEVGSFPLCAGGAGQHLSAGRAYPLSYTFLDGSSAPLFSYGVVPVADIERVARETAETLARRYGGQRVLLVSILRGGRIFSEMVLRQLARRPGGCGLDYEAATIQVRSYERGSQVGTHRILQPLQDDHGREVQDCSGFDGVVLIDDLIDGGGTMAWLISGHLPRLSAKGVGVCTMLDKGRPRSREVEETLAGRVISLGQRVPDAWLVGYGLDLALPGEGDRPALHLFRPALPGGIYAFNNAIEQRLLAEYRVNPQGLAKQLQAYLE